MAATDFDAAVERASALHSEMPISRHIDAAEQDKLARELFLELHQVFDAQDRVTVCRDKLVNEMLRFAPFRVVTLDPPAAAEASSQSGLPGLSGELRRYTDDILRHDLDFKRRVDAGGAAVDSESVQAGVQRCFWQSCWFVEAFNAARRIIGDTVEEGDWYLPFMHATCVNQEHLYRRMLDLPPLFDASVAQTVVSAYSIYTDIVVAGAKDPDREWREYCAGLDMPASAFQSGLRSQRLGRSHDDRLAERR